MSRPPLADTDEEEYEWRMIAFDRRHWHPSVMNRIDRIWPRFMIETVIWADVIHKLQAARFVEADRPAVRALRV